MGNFFFTCVYFIVVRKDSISLLKFLILSWHVVSHREIYVSLRCMCFILLLGHVICTCLFNLGVEISYYSCATISVFLSLNVCFICLRYLMLDVYIFLLVTAFWLIDHLIIIQYLSHCTFFSSVYFVWYNSLPCSL